MKTQRKEKDPGQWLGWVIFALVIAGGPILGVFQSATGIAVPSYALPALIGLAVVLNVGLSLFRTMTARSNADTRLPNGSETVRAPVRPAQAGLPNRPIMPVPSIGEQIAGQSVYLPDSQARSVAATQQQSAPALSGRMGLPSRMNVPPIQSPRFDPVITPKAVTISVIGLMLVIGVGIMLNF